MPRLYPPRVPCSGGRRPLSKFSDTVDHDVLMCRDGKRVSDKRGLRLIGAYLRARWCGEGGGETRPYPIGSSRLICHERQQ